MDEAICGLPPDISDEMSEDEACNNVITTKAVIENSEQPFSVELAVSPIINITQQKRGAKRQHATTDESGGVDEEGFTLVTRKSSSRNLTNKQPKSFINERDKNDVCLSSLEILPKQIGLARLFKSENIINASRIRYKNPYKVIISFEKREDALELINNKKIQDRGYRCHFTTEVDLTYGVVKYMELDISEQDLMKAFSTADCKIVSVKRLKRLSDNGEWVASETVRFGFKSSTLPTYIYGYDCRFKVEPYTYPVSQCGVCWRFGHTTRTCPSGKHVCPKCGGNHGNCESTAFRCVNCKGRHMAFSKICPVFSKEKEIRKIMSEHNVTYKVALFKYTENESYQSEAEDNEVRVYTEERHRFKTMGMSYSGALRQPPKLSRIEPVSSSEVEISESPLTSKKKRNKINKKEKKEVIHEDITMKKKSHRDSAREVRESVADDNEMRGKRNNYFVQIICKLKEIVMSNFSFEEKVQSVLKVAFDEVVSFVVKYISNGDGFSKLLGLFNHV